MPIFVLAPAEEMLGGDEVRAQPHDHQVVPGIRSQLPERPVGEQEAKVGEGPGVVDEEVETARVRLDRPKDPFDGQVVSVVATKRHHSAPSIRSERCRVVDRGSAGDVDLHSRVTQRNRDAPPDTATRAGDERDGTVRVRYPLHEPKTVRSDAASVQAPWPAPVFRNDPGPPKTLRVAVTRELWEAD
jgi:hypothetical protein